jgi:hypothetical protein
MSAAEILKRFVTDFGAPFLLGQPIVIGDALGVDGFQAIQHGLTVEPTMVDAIDEQLNQAALLGDVTPGPFDEDAAAFLYAAHELYASCHPQSNAFYARSHLFCVAAEQQLKRCRRTYDPDVLLTRHLIVKKAFDVTRTDVHLKWWTGSASFYGEEPPARLMAWPSIRRVNIDRKTQPMWRLASVDGDEDTRVARVSLMNTMLNLSPLSRLMMLGDPVQRQLPFTLVLPLKHHGKRMSPIFALDDRATARAVTDQLLLKGVDTAGPMLALALLSAVRKGAPPLAIRRATELAVHLALMLCIAEAEAPGCPEAAALRSLLDDDVAELDDAARVYWAAVAAGVSLDDRHLVIPSPHELPEASAELWSRVWSRLDHPSLKPVAEPLHRELSRKLPWLQDRVGQMG